MKKIIPTALASIVIAASFAAEAAKPVKPLPVPLDARVYGTVVDEQHTVGYFNDGGITGCPNPPSTMFAGLLPDAVAEAIPAWSLPGWTATGNLTAGIYDNGMNCSSSSACLRADFNSGDKTLSIDTRTTLPLRKFTLDLTDAYDLVNQQPTVNVPSVGSTVVTPGLFEVLGTASMTSMGICSSAACLEAEEYPAKFWFADAAGVTWRVDWRHMRVLRVSSNTWYFIANDCDGSQVAGLSKLEGSRTRPRDTNQGYFLVPFFISVTR